MTFQVGNSKRSFLPQKTTITSKKKLQKKFNELFATFKAIFFHIVPVQTTL